MPCGHSRGLLLPSILGAIARVARAVLIRGAKESRALRGLRAPLAVRAILGWVTARARVRARAQVEEESQNYKSALLHPSHKCLNYQYNLKDIRLMLDSQKDRCFHHIHKDKFFLKLYQFCRKQYICYSGEKDQIVHPHQMNV